MEKKQRILVADAGESFRHMLVETLSAEEEFQVVGETDDGQEVLRMVREDAPDVVVMDLVLLHIDGIELLGQLSAIDAAVRPKILVLSSYAKGTMSEVAAQAGADFQMLKPCKPGAVVDRIFDMTAGTEGLEEEDEGDRRARMESRVTASSMRSAYLRTSWIPLSAGGRF